MYEIDRMAAIIRPTALFVAWINENATAEEQVTLEDVQNDCTVLLVPVFDDAVEAENYIESIYQEVFTNELAAWSSDEANWPSPRSFSLFKQWFYIELNSYVFDTSSREDFITGVTTIQ